MNEIKGFYKFLIEIVKLVFVSLNNECSLRVTVNAVRTEKVIFFTSQNVTNC